MTNKPKSFAMRRKGKNAALELNVARALELRVRGLTFEQIGDELAVKATTAAGYVKRGLLEAAAKREEFGETIFELELHRLDELTQHVQDILETSVDEDTQLSAADKLLKVMKRRADMLGLDAPKVHEVNLKGVMEMAQEMAQIAVTYIPEEKHPAFIAEIRAMMRRAYTPGEENGAEEPRELEVCEAGAE